MDAGVLTWGGLIAFIVVAFIVDFFFFQRDHHSPVSLRRAAVWSVIWIGVAILFGVGLLVFESTQAGSEYLTGYLLERSLSLDNVFVFALIFSAMAVPITERQNVLELGIIFALILRAIFIVAGATLVESFSWVLYIFGAILLYTGIQMARHRGEEEDVDPEKNIGVRALKKVFPVTEDFRGSSYFVVENGKRMATPLLAVVAAVATADVIFAVDSIPAIFGITTDTFIVFAANAFALLGLRALFALLEGARDRFKYLTLGLAFILIFIGIKMLTEELWHMPVWVSLLGIVLALTISIVASLRATEPGEGGGKGGGPAPPPAPGRPTEAAAGVRPG